MPDSKRPAIKKTEGETLIEKVRKKMSPSVIFAGCDAPGEKRILERMAKAIDQEEYDIFHYHGDSAGVLQLILEREGYCFVFVGPHLDSGQDGQRWLLLHLGEWYGRNVHTIAVLDENTQPTDFGDFARFAGIDDVIAWNSESLYLNPPQSLFDIMALGAARKDGILIPEGTRERFMEASLSAGDTISMFDLLTADLEVFSTILDGRTKSLITEDLMDGMLKEHILCKVDGARTFGG
ncbi:MAG: hypothetical protein ABIH29_06190 [Candidatus Micrarchaeota archaeon]